MVLSCKVVNFSKQWSDDNGCSPSFECQTIPLVLFFVSHVSTMSFPNWIFLSLNMSRFCFFLFWVVINNNQVDWLDGIQGCIFLDSIINFRLSLSLISRVFFRRSNELIVSSFSSALSRIELGSRCLLILHLQYRSPIKTHQVFRIFPLQT